MIAVVLVIIAVIAFLYFAGKLKVQGSAIVGAANGGGGNGTQKKSKVSVKNGEVDIDVSGKGACACANGKCIGDCSDGSGSQCACANGNCVGDCDNGMMIDPENFDPFEFVRQHT